MNRKWLCGILCAFLFTQGPSLADDRNVTYAITDLGTLGGTSSRARSINDAGEIAGYATLPGDRINRAFIYSSGLMRELPSLGGTFATANRINDLGQAVGASDLPGDSERHAVLFDKGCITDLGTVPGRPLSTAFAINNAGLIFGASGTTDLATTTHAAQFVDGSVIDFGTLGGNSSFANGVNASGLISGRADVADGSSRAVFFGDGGITVLPGLEDTPCSARDVNDLGQFTGAGLQTPMGPHAFLWNNGTVTDLGTLGGSSSGPALDGILRINNCGQIVGRSATAAEEMHAFLWEKGQMTDLNELIPPNSGWILLEATQINNHGQIVGTGTIDGEDHAFLMTPEEESVQRELGCNGR